MTTAELAALSPLVATALTALVAMLLAAFRRNHSLVFWVCQLGLLAALGAVHACAPDAGNSVVGAPAAPLLRVDSFFVFFATLFLLLAMAVAVMLAQYFRRRPECRDGAEEAYVLLVVAALGALVLAAADHFASLFIGVELMGLASIVLVAWPSGAARDMDRLQGRSLEAGLRYLILSAAASALLLFGIALLYLQSGSLAFAALVPRQDDYLILLGTGLFLAGMAFKLSVVPFHLWTPDVYQGAPTPVTALIATLTKGALIAVLLRFLAAMPPVQTQAALPALVVLASLSMVVGNLLALRQENIKRLLAYSSIAHMGYLLVPVMAAGSGQLSAQAVAFYVAAYAITTLGAFSVVNGVSEGAGSDGYQVSRYRGLLWRAPWLGASFTLILLSLAGIPLTLGFVGKFYIFAAGADARLWLPVAMVVVGSVIGLYYYLRIILAMAQSPEGGEETPGGWRERWLSYGLTALLVVLGIYPSPLVDWLPVL